MEFISIFVSFFIVFSIGLGGVVLFIYLFNKIEEIFGEGFVNAFLVLLGLSGIFTILYYIK